jgi:succinyldiaminopimelate transaminase
MSPSARPDGPVGRPAAFVAPPYPYDRLSGLVELARRHPGGVVDLSIGTPGDPPPSAVVAALATSDSERGYPPSAGSPGLRQAAGRWLRRRFGVDVPPDAIGACVGTKELVATVPWLLRLARPERDVVLVPDVAYPTYAMGALLAGCRPVPVARRADGRLALDAVAAADVARALVLWVNSPSNPTGELVDLADAAAWGRGVGVPVLSDECYVEFTWDGAPRTILASGSDGVVAVHSLSKRSNAAGVRCGFYAGDQALVHELVELRRHLGMMVPGPVQAAAIVAWDDDDHVRRQRDRYLRRLRTLADALGACGVATAVPAGGFYLWVAAPEDWGPEPGWVLARALASVAGVVASPGDLYGEAPARHVRLALVVPDGTVDEVARRLRGAGSAGLEAAAHQPASVAPG